MWSTQPVGNLKGPQGASSPAEPSGPYCECRLNANVSVQWDTRPVTSWKSTADVDTHSMYHYNEGGDTWWQIPQAGRYAITLKTIWADFGAFNAAIPPWVATSLLLNSSGTHSPLTYGIAEQSAFHATNGGGWLYLQYAFRCEDRVFAAGDKLRVNYWSEYGGTLVAARGLEATSIQITYLRPN